MANSRCHCKIAIPVVIFYFTYNQVEINNRSLDTQKKIDTKTKLLEMSWEVFLGNDTAKKRTALDLLSTLDKELAAPIAKAINKDSSQPEIVRKSASRTLNSIIFEGYRIDIFYKQNNPKLFEKLRILKIN